MSFKTESTIVMGIMLAAMIAWFCYMVYSKGFMDGGSRLQRGGFGTLMVGFFGFITYARVHAYGVGSIEPFGWFVLGAITMSAIYQWVKPVKSTRSTS
jgi:hypothetical protein